MISSTSFAAEQNYEMNWIWQNCMFLTKYHNNDISFSITFRDNILHQIPTNAHTACSSQQSNGETTFTYTYGNPIESRIFAQSKQTLNEQTSYNSLYHVHTPLTSKNIDVNCIAKEDLRTLLKEKCIAWYTGAGISAAVVPTMTTLETSLGIIGTTANERSCNLIAQTLQNPNHTANTMLAFYEQCLHGKPTAAHKVIADYVRYKKDCIVFTENLDTLHEQTGVTPKRIDNPEEFIKEISPELIQKIDLILCVGLSHDDRGFLGYYKYHNPKGIIVALCLDKPTYLDKNDYFLQKDAQKSIPQLIQNIMR